jgi:hypothetical protein
MLFGVGGCEETVADVSCGIRRLRRRPAEGAQGPADRHVRGGGTGKKRGNYSINGKFFALMIHWQREEDKISVLF